MTYDRPLYNADRIVRACDVALYNIKIRRRAGMRKVLQYYVDNLPSKHIDFCKTFPFLCMRHFDVRFKLKVAKKAIRGDSRDLTEYFWYDSIDVTFIMLKALKLYTSYDEQYSCISKLRSEILKADACPQLITLRPDERKYLETYL